MYGGHTEFWFSRQEYNYIRDKGALVAEILRRLEDLTEQFPEYDMIRVIMETNKINSLRPTKNEEKEE